ncbi:hypothetical protein [Agarivorans sp.]|uniref:hypothetical protein n=1 Tax=Agarivorans sp. TaxID=1872412 RepID=UPI003D067002
MKLNYLWSLALTTALLSWASNVNASINQADLYGSWHCKTSLEENGVKIFVDMDANYIRNGKSNGFGFFVIRFPDGLEVKYSVTGSGVWQLKNGYLIETSEEIKVVNLSHPRLDKILDMESLFPQNVSESSKVLQLNKSFLKVKSETNGTVIGCKRS